jgi:lactate permease
MLGMRLSEGVKLFFETIHSLRFPIITIASVLGFAYIANFSGMSIAMGVALAATGALFPFFSPLLGWLGVFITGSCTSSNALFGKLQYVTATEIGVDPVVTVAGNASGGVTGKMISPQSIAVASAAVGLVGREGDLFRFAIKHSILLALFLSVVVTLQAYVFTGLIPVYEMVEAAAAVAAAPVFPTLGVTYLAVTAGVLAAVYIAVAMLNRGKN